MYQHRNWQGELLELPAGKVVCVGSNYAKHISEMGSITPKSRSSLLNLKRHSVIYDSRCICLPVLAKSTMKPSWQY
ncbi:Uncharacterised protein [Tatumella ptyseos]|uniref:2-keto-4-pentenoate hydratase/2-oxohepta-3-ene-1,7-dioic acid hydratase (Catechol pathway) n=1 Tax=Tatumella ptyseos TaxID=82987 RepID=A0A2X5PEC8_9GAMM|nr:Uncharacterised protein [Tatumella ptyseos]